MTGSTAPITRIGILDQEIVPGSDGSTVRARLISSSTDDEVDTWVYPFSVTDAGLARYLLTECRPDDLLHITGILHLPPLDEPEQVSWVEVTAISLLETGPVRENPDNDRKLADLIGPEHTSEMLELWTEQVAVSTGSDWRTAAEEVARRLSAGDPDLMAASGQTWMLNRSDPDAPGPAIEVIHRAACADTLTARVLASDLTPGPEQTLPVSVLAPYTLSHWTRPNTPAQDA